MWLALLLASKGLAAPGATAAGYVFKHPLGAPQTLGLLMQWSKLANDLRASGFRGPSDEAIGQRAIKLKSITERLPRLKAKVNIIALCEKGSLSYDTLQEPHRSDAERLSRTRVEAAISAGRGSSLALVSTWDDHVSIDDMVSNPSYLVAGEDAERALLDAIVDNAAAAGCSDVRLRAPWQADGDEFYAPCGFYPSDELEEGMLRYVAA